MVFIKKRSPAGDTGSSSQVGADDWNALDDYFDGVATGRSAEINTLTSYRPNWFNLRNALDTASLFQNSGAITANRTVTWPALTADDVPVTQAFTQPLTNKTIDVVSNTVAVRGPWTVLLTKVGSTYYAIKHDGTILSSSTTAETVINAAITNKGLIRFANNNADSAGGVNWTLSGSFTGFTLNVNTRIISDSVANIWIIVPQGFSGNAFKVGGSVGDPVETVGIEGLSITEGGTPQKLWTGIKL